MVQKYASKPYFSGPAPKALQDLSILTNIYIYVWKYIIFLLYKTLKGLESNFYYYFLLIPRMPAKALENWSFWQFGLKYLK